MSPGAHRAATAAVWLLAAAIALALGVQRHVAAASDPQPDLGGFFVPAAEAILAGESPYGVAGYFYSPVVALLLVPFVLTDTVLPGWTALRVLAAIAACVVAGFACTPRGAFLRAGGVTVIALITLLWSWPLTLDLWAGQVQTLVLLTTVTAALAATRGRPFIAGLALGLGAVVKTWPALFAVWLLRSRLSMRWREGAGIGVAAAVALALAGLTGGPAGIVEMVRSPFTGAEQPLLAANSAWGLPRILFSETPMAEPLAISAALQTTTTIVLVLWVLLLGALALVRPGPPAIALFNVAFLVILLLPVSHYFYVICAIPTLWWWVARLAEHPRRTTGWAAVAVLAIWWVVVFRIAPAGDGFMTTTWPSLLRIFAASLLAATVSVVCAAVLDAKERAREPARPGSIA